MYLRVLAFYWYKQETLANNIFTKWRKKDFIPLFFAVLRAVGLLTNDEKPANKDT